jgi:amidase
VFNFETPMEKYQLDAIPSINNNNSGHAAGTTTLAYNPMGYKTTGEPWGLTFIARPYQEDALLKWVLPLKSNQTRKLPNDYK